MDSSTTRTSLPLGPERSALPSWATLLYALKANSFPPVVQPLAADGGVDGLEVASATEMALAREVVPTGLVAAAGPAKHPGLLADLVAGEADVVHAESLLALRHGLENELPLPRPVTGAPGPDCPRLPASLPEAAARLEASVVARKGLGDGLVEALVAAARAEWAAYTGQVSEWERARGFEAR